MATLTSDLVKEFLRYAPKGVTSHLGRKYSKEELALSVKVSLEFLKGEIKRYCRVLDDANCLLDAVSIERKIDSPYFFFRYMKETLKEITSPLVRQNKGMFIKRVESLAKDAKDMSFFVSKHVSLATEKIVRAEDHARDFGSFRDKTSAEEEVEEESPADVYARIMSKSNSNLSEEEVALGIGLYLAILRNFVTTVNDNSLGRPIKDVVSWAGKIYDLSKDLLRLIESSDISRERNSKMISRQIDRINDTFSELQKTCKEAEEYLKKFILFVKNFRDSVLVEVFKEKRKLRQEDDVLAELQNRLCNF